MSLPLSLPLFLGQWSWDLSTALAPLDHGFMLRAFALGSLVAAVCAVLSCFLVLRGWSLMGDAISHAVLPGIVLAYIAGLPLGLGAFASGLLCATATGWIKRHCRVKEDTVMGVVFTGLFALGLVLHVKTPSDLHLDHILFGNIMGIEPARLRETTLLGVIVLATVLLMRRSFLLAAFDPAQARALGFRLRVLDTLLLALLALAIVAALQAVGIILVIAMLVTPGATAFLLVRRFDAMLAVAVAGSVFSTLAGTYVAFFADASPAACIVLIQAALFVAALCLAPGKGLLRRARPASALP